MAASDTLSGPALFVRFPELRERIPWTPLGRLPTPVMRLALPHLGEIWVKRDDQSASPYGGNKVRKLEHLLADAVEQRARRIVTLGGWGSHHVLATAIYGQKLGLPVSAIVFPQPVTGQVEATLRATLAQGARLLPVRSVALPAAWFAARIQPGTYAITGGGSSPLGALGYVSCALELAIQVRAGLLPAPRDLVVAQGSSGTAAGLWLGLALAGLNTRLVAVRVVPRPVASRARIVSLARKALLLMSQAASGTGFARPRGRASRSAGRPARRAGSWSPPRFGELLVMDGQVGRGYGHPTPGGDEAVALARHAGLALEPTYTGKALAGLIALAERGALRRPALFVHTYAGAELGPLSAGGPPIPEPVARMMSDQPLAEGVLPGAIRAAIPRRRREARPADDLPARSGELPPGGRSP